MVGKNPFDEPHDQDRTVIRPSPGGARRAQMPPASPSRSVAAPLVGDAVTDDLALGDSPLVSVAAPLLQLLARLNNTASRPDIDDLRARALSELRRFEQAARAASVPMEQLRPAHFVLCASLDDVVLNTPWGADSTWGKATLVASFHPDLTGPDRFAELLARLRRDMATNGATVELVYLCMSLGFMAGFRAVSSGASRLERLRQEIEADIASHRAPVPPALSQHWQGVAAPFRRRRPLVPTWVVMVLSVSVVGGLYVLTSRDLNAASDAVAVMAIAAPPARMPVISRAALPEPPPPAPRPPNAQDRLRAALKAEIEQGRLEVLGTESAAVIRIPARLLFPSANAALARPGSDLLDRVAAALKPEPGRLAVLAYTDSQPFRSVQFPSNFQLSAARAKAVASALQRPLGPQRPITSEGRAAADPVAPETDAAGSERNRRVEITLRAPEPGN